MDVAGAINICAAYLGVASGISGLILGILNYFRDRPNVQITLQWDMEPFGSAISIYGENKLYCMVSITNIGRRPIFVSHAYLKVPKVTEFLLISDTVTGEKLLEGDPPKNYPVSQNGFEKYSDRWSKIRAVIIDSTGKKYYSKPALKKPSWAMNLQE